MSLTTTSGRQKGCPICKQNFDYIFVFCCREFRHADDTTLMAESKEELQSLLMRVKEEIEKADLKLDIKKTKIMTSGPITSWHIEGEKVEAMTVFLFCSKITVDCDCSHEIRRQLLLCSRVMTNLNSVLKSKDITLLTKICNSKGYGLSSIHV